MKTTFLFAIARSGSLALSRMFNTDKCIAFHEGNDYHLVHKKYKFEESYAGQQWIKAKKEGRNYFCCDISQPINTFKAYIDYINNHCHEAISETKIILVDSCVDCATESLSKILGCKINSDTTVAAHHLLSEQRQSLIKCAEDLSENVDITVVIKNHNKKFHPLQVIEMNKVIQAWDLSVSGNVRKLADIAGGYHSMTKEELMNGVNIIKKHDKKPFDIKAN